MPLKLCKLYAIINIDFAYNIKGGIDMKTNVLELKKRAKELVLISKQKGIIKPHTEAFKDFPVKEEKHKGKNHK